MNYKTYFLYEIFLKLYNRLRVPLDVYIDSPVETAHILLNKVHLNEISDFVDTFLKRYMLNNNLQNDTVLCTYIQVGIILYNFYKNIIKDDVFYNIKLLLTNKTIYCSILCFLFLENNEKF